MEFAHVELHPDDGKHDDGEEEQQADLKQRDHGLHDGLQHHLEACGGRRRGEVGMIIYCLIFVTVRGSIAGLMKQYTV